MLPLTATPETAAGWPSSTAAMRRWAKLVLSARSSRLNLTPSSSTTQIWSDVACAWLKPSGAGTPLVAHKASPHLLEQTRYPNPHGERL